MSLFGTPSLEQMVAKRDIKGLINMLRANASDSKKYQPYQQALVGMGEEAIVPLINALNDSSHLVRFVVGLTLIPFHASAVEPLIAALNTANPTLKPEIAMVLSVLKDPRTVQPLLNILFDPDVMVRSTVASALGSLKDSRAVEPLIVLLITKNNILDTVPQTSAAEALGKIGDSRALDALQAVMQDPDPKLRKAADTAIRSIKGLPGDPGLSKA